MFDVYEEEGSEKGEGEEDGGSSGSSRRKRVFRRSTSSSALSTICTPNTPSRWGRSSLSFSPCDGPEVFTIGSDPGSDHGGSDHGGSDTYGGNGGNSSNHQKRGERTKLKKKGANDSIATPRVSCSSSASTSWRGPAILTRSSTTKVVDIPPIPPAFVVIPPAVSPPPCDDDMLGDTLHTLDLEYFSSQEQESDQHDVLSVSASSDTTPCRGGGGGGHPSDFREGHFREGSASRPYGRGASSSIESRLRTCKRKILNWVQHTLLRG